MLFGSNCANLLLTEGATGLRPGTAARCQSTGTVQNDCLLALGGVVSRPLLTPSLTWLFSFFVAGGLTSTVPGLVRGWCSV